MLCFAKHFLFVVLQATNRFKRQVIHPGRITKEQRGTL